LLRVVRIGYDEPSAHDARRRIVSFFNAHLSSQAQAPAQADRGGSDAKP
jgi:hypothetical protein